MVVVDELQKGHTFDYVIVGGGTAGCVIASRLAENLPNATILMIEGGANDFGNKSILSLKGSVDLWGSDEYDYGYKSVPQEFGNSDIIHSRAKMLGGCSSHNGGISFLPFTMDMRRWQKRGAEGWTHEQMIRLFKKLRNNIIPVDQRHRSDINKSWVQACSEAFNVPFIEDFNEEIARRGCIAHGVGFNSVSYTPEDNFRSSSSVAYIHPILRGEEKRPNLVILQNTWVSKILFNGQTATGVRAKTKTGQIYNVRASSEVILTAGAIDTPRLMLLSGLGPSAQLSALDIPLKQNIPGVGENLQDHVETMYMWEINEAVPDDQVVMGSECTMFLRREAFNAKGDDGHTADTVFHMFTVPFDFYTKPMGYETPKHGFCVIPYNPRPASVGRIYLKSANPDDKPALDQKYFSDPNGYDKNTNLFMLKMARKMAEAEPFKKFLKREIAPGPSVTTDEQLCEYGRKVSNTVYHPCGTARMGDVINDPLAVVDSRLCVRGVKHLRVADASVFPTMTSINPMVTVLCLAERAAEIVIEDLERCPRAAL